MTSFYNALHIFFKNPAQEYKKVLPYLKSRLDGPKRNVAEFLSIEMYSKSYPGHKELLAEIDFKHGFYVVCGGNDGYSSDRLCKLKVNQ